MESITKEEKALRDFLLDIRCLDPLEDKSTFNYFDVLKISRAEIRHSNVLAWLLDPNENHGLGAAVLTDLNAYIARTFFANETATVFQLQAMDYSDVLLYREWQNIDILVESTEAKYVLCIENKIGTQEHDDQLNRYYKIIESKYGKDYLKIYLYLTPEGSPPMKDNNDAWRSLKYETLIEIIENELDKITIEPRRKDFIKTYVETLRRETMNDTEIIKICQEIYKKHKGALDLIYEHRPDKQQNLFEIMKEWCFAKHGNGIIFVENKSSKSYCRFRTPTMDRLIPDSSSISGWGTNNHYFYEIMSWVEKSGEIRFKLQFVLSSQNLTNDEREKLEKIDKLFNPKGLKPDWQWRTVYSTDVHTIKESELELDAEKICEKMDKDLQLVSKNEALIEERIG